MENFPIHHVDSMLGPSLLARYEAGGYETSCNVSTKIWTDLHDDIEQQIRTSGTYHTESEIQKETSIRFMSRYVKDVQTIQEEWSGKEVITADDLLVTDRGVMTRVGDEYVPAEYEFITKRQEKGSEDRSESSVLRAVMGVMIASEDAEAYFPVHNQSSDGTDKIRHVAHWKRVGNRIKTEMINICGDQPDQTLSDAQRTLEVRIGREFILHQDSSRAYIFTRGVDKNRVRFTQDRVEKTKVTQNKIYAIPEYADSEDTRERLESPVRASESHNRASINKMFADTVIHVGNKVLHDTKDTAVSLGAFVLRKTFEQKSKQQIDSTRQDRQIANHITERIRELFSKNVEDRSYENKPARLTIEKIREKPEKIVKTIQTQHAEMQKSVAVLLIAAETKVAIGAAPLILAALAKEQPKQIQAVEKSIRRRNKKELRRKNYEVRKKAKEKEKKERAKENKRKKKRRKVYMRETAVGRIYTKRVVVEKKLPIATVRRVIRNAERVLETKRMPKKEKKLWVAVAGAAAEFARAPRQEKPERAVTGIRFAWVVWMILVRKDIEAPKSNFKRSLPAKQGETLRRQEETLWVLLSIIYYLMALREQAMHNHPVAQFIPVQQAIPQYAVIYAFAS